MPEYIWVNGRWMQRQPCQQQQGASMLQQPPPPVGNTLVGGSEERSSSDPALDPSARAPVSNDGVMSWIRRASESDLDPYVYLVRARRDYHLDQFDDNLAAAERYFDGLQGNYSPHAIAASALLKGVREIRVGDVKPFESVLGKNGSKAIEFVTRWGMLGADDRANGRTHLDRLNADSAAQK